MQGEILRTSLMFAIADRDVSFKYAGELSTSCGYYIAFDVFGLRPLR